MNRALTRAAFSLYIYLYGDKKLNISLFKFREVHFKQWRIMSICLCAGHPIFSMEFLWHLLQLKFLFTTSFVRLQ